MKKYNQLHGFTLIEILVSLVILSIGFLVFGLNIGKGIKSTGDISAQRSVGNLISQSVEHFYALNTAKDLATIKADVKNFNISTLASESNQIVYDDVSISISLAVDSTGKDLKTSDTTSWVKPYTLSYDIRLGSNFSRKIIQVLP